MAVILDHINGVGDANRITNPRVVCPNCAATFETHCGRQNSAGGRKYGVSDNAVRKWIRWYEAAAQRRDAA